MSVKYFKNGQLTLIAGAGGISGGGDCDCDSKIFTGTAAEYEAQKDNIEDGTIINITDDIEEGIFIDIEEVLNKIAELEADVEDIKQNGSGASSADNVTYDSTASGLEAATVQEAIDEMKEDFGGLRFGTDGEGNYGYFKGDDTFVPFKSDEVTIHYNSWILAGGLNPTEYATLNELLEDEAAVRTLMTKKTAVDVLTTLDETELDTIIRHRYAAKWINYREYAYSTLSAIDDIKDIMDETGMYGMYITTKSKLQPLVPVLTSNTGSDGGEASASSVLDNSGTAVAYKAFDGNDDTNWAGTYELNPSNEWIQYRFAVPTIVTSFSIRTIQQVKNFILKASNDGIVFEDLYSGTCSDVTDKQMFNIENQKAYLIYRLHGTDSYTSNDNGAIGIHSLQFYGYQFKALVSPMTSDIGFEGEVNASDKFDNTMTYAPYKAFDGDDESSWNSLDNGENTWICYDFKNIKRIKAIKIHRLTDGFSGNTNITADVQILSSDNNWTTIASVANTTSYSNIITLDDDVKSIKISQTSGNKGMRIRSLQFYGEDFWQPKGLVPVMTSNTTPYGEAISNADYNSSYEAWRAFTGNGSATNRWASPAIANSTAFIGYSFKSPTCVKQIAVNEVSAQNITRTFIVQASNDNLNWVNLTDTINQPYSTTSDYITNFNLCYNYNINNDNYYMYYRLFYNTTSNVTISTLQFYGRQCEALIPPMTSNTTPIGECSASSVWRDIRYPWQAFSNQALDVISAGTGYWCPDSGDIDSWLSYDFKKPTLVKMFKMKCASERSGNVEVKIQAYVNNNWEDAYIKTIDTLNTSSNENFKEKIFSINSNIVANKWRILTVGDNILVIHAAQFYGTPDYESRTYIYDHGVEVMEIDKIDDYGVGEKRVDTLFLSPANSTAVVNSTWFYTKNKIYMGPYNTCSIIMGGNVGYPKGTYGSIGIFDTTNMNTTALAFVRPFTELSTLPKKVCDISQVNVEAYAIVGVSETDYYDVSEWWLE